ncbi:MAG: hypothetical protein SGPRY_003452, partial [Prymnesium sp.]
AHPYDEMTISSLLELLSEADPSLTEVKDLLQKHSDELLRTLETTPSADQPGGSVKRPLFCAPTGGSPPATNPVEDRAATLVHLDEQAARRLLSDYKLEAYNDWSAFHDAASKPDPAPSAASPAPPALAPPPTPAPAPALFGAPSPNAAPASTAAPDETSPPIGPSAAEYLAALPAEAQLIEFAHEQRLLLLRCIQQMLAIIYQDSKTSLRNIVCGSVALLLQAAATNPPTPSQLPREDASLLTHGRITPVPTPTPIPAATLTNQQHHHHYRHHPATATIAPTATAQLPPLPLHAYARHTLAPPFPAFMTRKQGNLPERVLELLLDDSHTIPVEARLPKRLLGGQGGDRRVISTSAGCEQAAPPATALRAGMRMEVSEGSSWAVATLVEKSSGDAWNVKFDHGSLIQGVQADRMRVSRCHCF